MSCPEAVRSSLKKRHQLELLPHHKTGMIGTNNTKTDIVVPVVRIVVVPGRARQIGRFVVPRTPAQRKGAQLPVFFHNGKLQFF